MLIALLTDFGLHDTYVGQMKAVIAGIAPACPVIDLTHAVTPQQVREGAFHLEAALPALPAGSIVVAVVDPGVGSQRRPLALRTPNLTLIGPDNGLLSVSLPDTHRPLGPDPATIAVPPGYAATVLDPRRAGSGQLSETFHGRDLFAPAAARLAAGIALTTLGEATTEMVALSPFAARPQADDSLLAEVVIVDRFGNLITECRASQLARPPYLASIGGHERIPHVTTYAQAADGELVFLTGSGGYVEIARVNGSAAAVTGAGQGARVRFQPVP